MLQATLRIFSYQRRRLAGVGLAVMIGTGFLVLTMLAGQAFQNSFRDAVGREYRHIGFGVDLSFDPGATDWQSAATKISQAPGVTAVLPRMSLWAELDQGPRGESIPLTLLPPPGTIRDGLMLDSGRMPEHPDEVVLKHDTARNLGIAIGESLAFQTTGDDGAGSSLSFTLVGLWSGEGRFGSDFYLGFVTPEGAARFPSPWVSGFFVETDADADPAELEAAIQQAVPGGSVVTSAQSMIDQNLAEYDDQWRMLQLGITSFAILALIVAGLVVANTHAILIAQRTREIALLRCAGATARQVRGMVLTEAAGAGAIASGIGIALAWVCANALLNLLRMNWIASIFGASGESDMALKISLTAGVIAYPLIIGTAIAVVAAWAPARSAERVDPLQALRTAQAPAMETSGINPFRMAMVVLLLVGGAIFLLGGGAISHNGKQGVGIVLGMVGGLITFLGIIVALTVIVPVINRLILLLAEKLPSIPLRIATRNGVRNPRRAAASAVSLLIGVTLVSMMVVGAESLKTTMTGEIDNQAPWDLSIVYTTSLNPTAAAAFNRDVSQIDGVAATAQSSRVDVVITADTVDSIGTMALAVVPDELKAVWRSGRTIASFGPGVALIPEWASQEFGIRTGDRLTIELNGRSVSFEAIETGAWESIMIPASDVAVSGASVEPYSLIVRVTDDANPTTVLDAIHDIASDNGVSIASEGMVETRRQIQQALDVLLGIVTGLLAVAVAIAIVGVSNTLSLSVIERTRESALLRSFGYTRQQLRRTLMYEGLLLAMVGSSIGLAAGTLFGWIGAYTLIGNTASMSPGFPAGRMASILLISLACGLLASVLPARRAATVDPVVALADA